MLPHLALFVLGLQTSSIYATWFPSPTGNNGLEEYAQAADLLNSPEYAVFEHWRPADPFPLDTRSVPITTSAARDRNLDTPAASSLRAQLANLDYGKLCSLEASRFANILVVIRQGNVKPIVRPRSARDAANFAFVIDQAARKATNLILRVAYSQFSEGHTDQAVGTLLDAFGLLDRMDRLSSVSTITSNFISPYVTGFIDLRLGQLNLADCRTLLAATSRILNQTSAMRGQLEDTLDLWLDKIGNFVKSASKPLSGERGVVPEGMIDEYKISDEILKMTPDRRQTLLAQCQSKAQSVFALLLPRFDGPEGHWLDPLPDSPFFRFGGITNDDDLVSRIVSAMQIGATRTQIAQTLKGRTRMRLLDTHSQILIFRWTHGRLPANLEECGKGLSADPLTNGTLKYEVRADGTYDLYSEGTKETGPIRLRPDQPASPNANRTHP